MSMPQKLPIKRMEDYHTHYIGRYQEGKQFLGQTGARVKLKNLEDTPLGWENNVGEYVVLHTFDSAGNHLNTQCKYLGTVLQISQKGSEPGEKILKKWIEELGSWNFSDIAVRPFQVILDNHVFGLVVNDESGCIDLMPDMSISFMAPWDGEYYT